MTSEKTDICFLMATMCTIPFIPKLLLLYSFVMERNLAMTLCGRSVTFHDAGTFYESRDSLQLTIALGGQSR